jgi:hypothetical protein
MSWTEIVQERIQWRALLSIVLRPISLCTSALPCSEVRKCIGPIHARTFTVTPDEYDAG